MFMIIVKIEFLDVVAVAEAVAPDLHIHQAAGLAQVVVVDIATLVVGTAVYMELHLTMDSLHTTDVHILISTIIVLEQHAILKITNVLTQQKLIILLFGLF